MAITAPDLHSRSPSLSSSSSVSESLEDSLNDTSKRTPDPDTPNTSLRPSLSPSPSPEDKPSSCTASPSVSNESPHDYQVRTNLPTPFWPVSLQNEKGSEKPTGSGQAPQLPSVFPSVPAYNIPEVPADADIRTPDAWLKRNSERIRLTGKHPLNTEGRLTDVFGSGFITPVHLHFVRNHGAVPKLPPPSAFLPSPASHIVTRDSVNEPPFALTGLSNSGRLSVPPSLSAKHPILSPPHAEFDPYAHWSIEIHGLVAQACTLTIKELAALFQVVSIPITLVCAGNRRKEQNVVRKSLGFDWGAAGLSTALWTGVYLADILAHVRPERPKAKYVIFEGADELPKGPYGTSQKLSWAADKGRGMLIAWAMNGLPLEPDHGFPVRLVVPGQIGGRSVKWLTRIEVSDVESNHYLHYWDNKVLPMQLTPEQARAEPKWWYDPNYIITELNVNSAIAHPAHGETVIIPSEEIASIEDAISALDIGKHNTKAYTVKGYAYAGGGRRITRVELSWDDGQTWHLAEIDYPEDQFRQMKSEHPMYGLFDLYERDTCFCWCFWTFRLPFALLAQIDCIMVRAMDEGMNLQPRDMYLNATSMMNNWWFRVAVCRTKVGSCVQLHFEHPAVVGTTRQGWMDRLKGEGKDILRPSFTPDISVRDGERHNKTVSEVSKPEPICMTKTGVDRKITVQELKAQDKEKPWFVVRGEVYDGTGYLRDHPGGADSILLVAGEDATDDFMAIHSADAKKKLAEFHIGTLSGILDDPSPSSSQLSDVDMLDAPFLDPKIWKSVVLSAIERVNHDSLIYRFTLLHSGQRLGLPVGQHVFVRLGRKDTGELVQRAYTPVSREDARGSLEFLIKLYLPSKEYPAGGKMTVGFNQLSVGDTLEVKGPLGSFIWQGAGRALWKGVPRHITELGLVCGGSGITPILQVIRSVLHDASDSTTRLWLIFANKTEADILCREELDALLRTHGASGRFHLHHTLGCPPAEGWTYSEGRVNESMLREHLPPPTETRMILACGPTAMIEQTMKEGLQKIGWNVARDVVVF